MRPTQWLIRSDLGDLDIIAGPFPAEDDDQMEAAMVEAMTDHPFDLEPDYYALVLSPDMTLELIQYEESYITALQDEAWGIEEVANEQK